MKKCTKKIFSTAVYLLILLTAQLPWFVVEGKRKSIYGLYRYAVGLNTEFTGVFHLQIIVFCLFQFFCVAYILTVFLKKRWHFNIVAWTTAVCMMAMALGGMETLSENWEAICYPLTLIILCALEYIFPKIVDAIREEEDGVRRQKQRDKEEKAEKKERLYFAGKYNKLFFYMIWKNFRYNWRDYMLFLVCGTMVSTLAFVGLGSYEMMKGIHSGEVFILSSGLGNILWKALLPIGVCIIIIMVFVLLFYLKKRMLSYSMFLVLGARRKTMYVMIALEIILSLMISLACGCMVGNIVLWILKRHIVSALSGSVVLASTSWITYLKMFGAIIAVYLIAFMATRDIATDMQVGSAETKKLQAEKMPVKRQFIMILIGILLCVWSMTSYSKLRSHEDIKLVGVFFAGAFLIIRYGMAKYLQREKMGKKYLSKLLKRNHLYHRSRTNAWYMGALALISTCAVFYFTVQIASLSVTEDSDTLFPYDFVCIAEDEDKEFFQNLSNTYDLEMLQYPMVRVSSADGSPMMEPKGQQPVQGQHIGISETTYHKLKKELHQDYKRKSLGVNGTAEKIGDEKVYIVHQQDRSVQAQIIDWMLIKKKPYLHIGQPCPMYSITTPHKITGFPPYTIAGEEIGSLTGCFRQGMQENLVVFSDAYFSKAQDMWKDTNIQTGKKLEEEEMKIPDVTIRQGPTTLVLICAKKEDLGNLEKEMKIYAQMPHHQYDMAYNPEISCYYSKETAMQDLATEHVMRRIVNVSVIVTLMISYAFLMWIKVFSEMDEKKRRSEFLKTMGMRRKERVQLLNRELYLFFWVPAVITILTSAGFTVATFHARMYTSAVVAEYIRHAAWIWGVCFLFEGIVFVALGMIQIHKVEMRQERKWSR